MEWLTQPEIWISLLTLTVLEIVLGIDNIIFISILAGKLPPEQQAKARNLGLSLALITRVLLLLSLSFLAHLTKPLFHVFAFEVTARSLILILGGLFLIYKSVHEIHEKLEGSDGEKTASKTLKFSQVIYQILILDIVFSLDSVITAIGMANVVGVMIAAVVIAMIVMLLAAGSIAAFVERHPTIKMLALSFLLMIGIALVGEGTHHEIPKGYIYFAMAFSVCVELLNLKTRGKKVAAEKPIEFRQPYR